jgi:hypothetical protein
MPDRTCVEGDGADEGGGATAAPCGVALASWARMRGIRGGLRHPGRRR